MTRKCYIGGCIKNCSSYLSRVFKNIVKICEIFDEYTVIIAFDKSSDNSLDILLQLKKKYENRIKIVIIVNNKLLNSHRTFNIANARNSIIDYIKRDNDESYQYFIMMDMDDVCSNLIVQPDILEKYLINDHNWDSLSFNLNNYYDIWALSIDHHLFSCWHFQESKNYNDSVSVIKTYIMNKLNIIKENELLVCQSAFNGFALYKKNKFINCKYDGYIKHSAELIGYHLIDNQEKVLGKKFDINKSDSDCEHRFFHFQAIKKNNAKIRISPLKLFKYD